MSQLERQINNDWYETSTLSSVLFVLSILKEMNKNNQTHTFSVNEVIDKMYQKNMTIHDGIEIDIAKALNYFADPHIRLVDVVYCLYEGDSVLEIMPDDINDAKKHGSLIHPETGVVVDNYADKISILFKPSSYSYE